MAEREETGVGLLSYFKVFSDASFSELTFSDGSFFGLTFSKSMSSGFVNFNPSERTLNWPSALSISHAELSSNNS